MNTDASYMPLDAEFCAFMGAAYPNVLAVEQIKAMKSLFFAGAAASYQLLTETPERKETLFDELVDHADQFEGA